MVLRVRDPRSVADIDDRDGALIRDEGDLLAARARRFKTAVFLEGVSLPDDADGFEVTVGSESVLTTLATATSSGSTPGRSASACCTGGLPNTTRS